MPSDIQQEYSIASARTMLSLKTVAHSSLLREVSHLSLPEIEAVVALVSRAVPAGNVPGIILSGLAKLGERKLAAEKVRRDINALFRGVEETLDTVVAGALFAGPAAVIWGYQSMLRLVGKTPEDAFPDGTWQFYVDYALREDTARHANETHGFDTRLRQHDITLSLEDRITAWLMAVIHGLHEYNALLHNEWYERVSLHLLYGLTGGQRGAERYAHAYRLWETQRPYTRETDSRADETYAQYRRRTFDAYLATLERDLGRRTRAAWREQLRAVEECDLAAYQRQMTILAYLDPGRHGETRTPLALAEAQVGVIYGGRYHLIPACVPGASRPAELATVRAQVVAIVQGKTDSPAVSLAALATMQRRAWLDVRGQFSKTLRAELDLLRKTPVLLNVDLRPRNLPLAELRQAERGVGDHALTLFDTGSSMVFDQSHIFFDGAWGAAFAEILTNEALAWANFLRTQPLQGSPVMPVVVPSFQFSSQEAQRIAAAPHVTPEVSAENDEADLRAVQVMRRLLRQRNEDLRLTVNDVLLLYRAIHAVTYRVDPALYEELERGAHQRKKSTRAAYTAALEAINLSKTRSPAILIPVDASPRAPRERLHPLTLEVPLAELDLLALHQRTLAVLEEAQDNRGARKAFAEAQGLYLATLGGLGAWLAKLKALAAAGESAAVGTIKLLAYLPKAMQRMLDQVPRQIDMLNDLIKGREVFSNVGAVAPTSSLQRFITAKDDNEQKTLAWGVITDADGILHITLRDFRPHVALLIAEGRRDVARRMTQDYLAAYVRGLNQYVYEVQRIARVSQQPKRKR